MNIQLEDTIGQDLGGPRSKNFCLCGVEVHHPSVEAPQTAYYWDFMKASSCRHNQLLANF